MDKIYEILRDFNCTTAFLHVLVFHCIIVVSFHLVAPFIVGRKYFELFQLVLPLVYSMQQKIIVKYMKINIAEDNW